MQREPLPGQRGLIDRFYCAFRGVSVGLRVERNFVIHFAVAAAVIVAAAFLQCSVMEWGALFLAIGTVLSAELFNTAIEHLAKTITSEHDERIRNALDVASGAVLVAANAAALVGVFILGHRLAEFLSVHWWIF